MSEKNKMKWNEENCIIIIHTATPLLLYAYRKCLQNGFLDGDLDGWVAKDEVADH
jgi:hypothetical protein